MSDDTQRYKMVPSPASHCSLALKDEKGEWVKYSDHIKAIEAKDKEIERLNREIIRTV